MRFTTAGLLIAIAVAASGFALPAGQDTPEEISAHRFTLIDSEGFPCAALGTERAAGEEHDDVFLTFRTLTGMAATLHTGKGRPFLTLQGAGNTGGEQWRSMVKIGADDTFGPHVILSGTAAGPDSKMVTHRTDLRVPWTDYEHCVELTSGRETKWSAP